MKGSYANILLVHSVDIVLNRLGNGFIVTHSRNVSFNIFSMSVRVCLDAVFISGVRVLEPLHKKDFYA